MMTFAKRSLGCIAVLTCCLAAMDARAQESKEWYRPTAGDLELGISGNFGHLFNTELTSLDLQVNFGYFFTDFLEGGVGLALGYFGTPAAKSTTSALAQERTGSRQQALAAGAVAGGREWYGGTELWLRLFPFVAFSDDLLPDFLGPFVHAEVGALYARDVSPYFAASLSVGLNIYVTNQIALTPEFGYGFVYASDSGASFAGESVEHILAANFGLSVFFTP